MVVYGQNQNNIVKQISCNKKKNKRKMFPSQFSVSGAVWPLRNLPNTKLPHPSSLSRPATHIGREPKGKTVSNVIHLASLCSVQFSSVTQSCPTLCNPMNRSTPGLPVHHQLLEFTQTHIHRVGDAIQPSHPLLSPSPPAPNPSQHQSLFQ